ncbi:hypothetical protein M2475_001591 [Breznakia sp. PF5-3]|uniref:DUF4097 family beta strand repeat-containing protein n=1 Tax=unclassified Breznakia TaxID=2623764 RepID=UPI002404E751|nr:MULTISPECIES: DUF4097 family beta strand repeat-containing protein [unclassified Breznakia]MDF9825124.1 hypothetical protein [Breznakia sp. PM6-1]MDF9836017.1 hypothetical protein [Breznakia sp. PF5-3]MDF9838115.1 hypothetical protein [Breznakia sp. PFB2-8]MDF9860055.1 hypothetical protein [Breznakia sp. PH5-24]
MRNRKKPMRSLMLISAIFILVGIVITTIGISQGGMIYAKQYRLGPVSTTGWSDGKNFRDSKTYTTKSSVKSINIEADAGEVYIKEADKFSIEVKNYDVKAIEFKDNDGDISLSTGNQEIVIFPFTFWDDDSYERKITIYVPKSCKSLEVDADLGNVEMNDISIDNLSLSLNLGSLEAKNIKVKTGKLDLDLGDAEFSGDFKESLVITNNLGSIDITLAGSIDDYGYSLDTDLGEISIGGNSYHSHKDNNGGKRLLKADADLGEINVFFNK